MEGDGDFRFSPRPNRAADIAWRPWGEPAFAEARRLGRPVLLSLSAVWCHWCHVMDETSYSDPAVIAAINEQYVPVRVDNDRRPDVNRRYNMGGWPTTAFLTPAGDIITGATYVPPEQLRQALDRVREFFDANASSLQDVETRALEEPGEAPPDTDERVLAHIPDELVAAAVRSFDPAYGGIGTEPKFPQPDVFAFLLAFTGLRPRAADTPRAREVVVKTLEAMARGGLNDHGGEGFFRYATQRDWSEPHYEKMLEDEARLAALYLDAAAAAEARDDLGDPDLYRQTATRVLDYLLGTLWRGDPPAFGGSQDADETYYRYDAEGRRALPAPAVDPTILADWNALAAAALLRGGALLERPELAQRGLETLAFLWESLRRDGLIAHFALPSGVPSQRSPLFGDQAAVTAALLDAYEVIGQRQWLDRAQELATRVESFASADGRFHDRLPREGDSAGLLAQPVPALDDNVLMADAFLRLASFTGDERYRDRALDVLTAWVPYYQRYGVGAAPYGRALLRAAEHPAHVAIVGRRADDATAELHAVALVAQQPLRTVQLLDPDDPTDARHIEASGYGPPEQATAFVCRGRTCGPPLRDQSQLAAALRRR